MTPPYYWVGVDLDGTLSEETLPVGNTLPVGPPIPRMVARVQALLHQGVDVRIFTARVGCCGESSSVACDDQVWAEQQRELIAAWCLEHLGQVLPVTATKDFQMAYFYDDRCREMIPNTGETLRERIGEGLIAELTRTAEIR